MHKRPVRFTIALTLITALSLFAPLSHGLAQSPPPRNPSSTGSVEDDGGTAEVGVEWITDWPGTADDRANWYYSANNLYNELRDAGWIGRFNYGNTNAWERDFKAASYGGINDSVIDSVDLAMIGTHGTSAWDPRWGTTLSAVYFSSNNDDWYLSPGEAYRAYGNNDLEWLAFDSCSVLRDDSMWYWHETFDGLHLMLGFANTMYVVYPGDGGKWGDQMRQKGWWIFGHGAKTVTQAWFSAVEDQQPSGVRARVLAEELNNYNDYIWGQGYVSPDPVNNGGYWYWDHVAGTPPPLQLTAVPTTALVYRIAPRTVTTTYVQSVGRAFGLTGEVLANPDGSAFYMAGGISDSLQLRVDTASGGYLFQNLDELWTNPEMTRTLPSPAVAQRLSLGFLSQHDFLPGLGGFFNQQVPPTVDVEGPADGLVSATLKAPAIITPTDYMVSYARQLDAGNGQLVSVVGPGSRLNVYIGDNGEVIGLKGGARSVSVVAPGQGPQAAADTVPLKTPEKAWESFLANPTIALAQPPLATRYDFTGKPEPTLGYYEQPLSMHQSELVPVWIFVADLYTGTLPISSPLRAGAAMTEALVASNVNIYVPAADDPKAVPQVSIVEPLTGTVLMPGQPLTLTAEIVGGVEPYTVTWTSSVSGVLGTGTSIVVPGLTPDLRLGQLQPNLITVLVVDANGQTATAEVTVTVMVQTYLPILVR